MQLLPHFPKGGSPLPFSALTFSATFPVSHFSQICLPLWFSLCSSLLVSYLLWYAPAVSRFPSRCLTVMVLTSRCSACTSYSPFLSPFQCVVVTYLLVVVISRIDGSLPVHLLVTSICPAHTEHILYAFTHLIRMRATLVLTVRYSAARMVLTGHCC